LEIDSLTLAATPATAFKRRGGRRPCLPIRTYSDRQAGTPAATLRLQLFFRMFALNCEDANRSLDFYAERSTLRN